MLVMPAVAAVRSVVVVLPVALMTVGRRVASEVTVAVALLTVVIRA
ncbi:MAG: hypothetical protein KDB21_14180 [Acidimicrobiales bacterium]|nr:hypothetical protein [Acidimicrobiales bacterium]